MDRPLAVDSHMHLWTRPTADHPHVGLSHPWCPDPHPFASFRPVMDLHGVRAAVQVTPTLNGFDNAYGIGVARAEPDVVYVLGRLDLSAPGLERRLRTLTAQRGVVGIRLTIFRADDDRILDSLSRLFAASVELGSVVSIYAPERLGQVVELLNRHPRTRLWLDHAGVAVHPGAPDVTAGVRWLPELAAFPNVYVKLSGLPEISTERYPFADTAPVVAAAVDHFGSERLLWGSDYPNVLKACSYRESLSFLGDLWGGGHRDELNAVLGGNLARLLTEGTRR